MKDLYKANFKKIGEQLKVLRLEKGFGNYRPFANELDMEPKQYWRLEHGESDFRYSSLIRVLKYHEISLEEFFASIKL